MNSHVVVFGIWPGKDRCKDKGTTPHGVHLLIASSPIVQTRHRRGAFEARNSTWTYIHAPGGFYALPCSPPSLVSECKLSTVSGGAGACGELADGVGMAMDAGVEAADSTTEGEKIFWSSHEAFERSSRRRRDSMLTER